MDSNTLKKYLIEVSEIAEQAGVKILEVYDSEFAVEHKDDKSPLTEADRQSHLAIQAGLEKTPFPILSEEGKAIEFEERKDWATLWIVDPLDGTKEFIKRNGEFTVNIALIEENQPILGVIYVPVKDQMYIGARGLGAFKIDDYSKISAKNEATLMADEFQIPKKIDRPYTIVGSRSHMSEETEAYVAKKREEIGEVEMISVGSSLKLCMVAEGLADDYPRFAPTMEWDTAAGQSIVQAAGGKVINWKSKEIMRYNRENLLNDWFLVTA